EIVRRHVLALDLVLRHVGPVDVEVVVVDQGVRALAVLGLERLQLCERALARLLDQALLDVRGQLDRVDAEVALVVELDRRVARGARSLLVRGQERVLEGVDQGLAVDPLLLLDDADRLDDLFAHLAPSSIRLPRTIESYGISIGSPLPGAPLSAPSPAPTSGPGAPV